METTEVKFVKWPVQIDHIEVRETSYVRNGETLTGKTFLFYVNPAFDFGFDRPSIMTVFENSALAEKYKDLKTETIDGATVITAATIKAALEPGKTEAGPYKGIDEAEYSSYGEYLLTLGSKRAFDPKNTTPGIVFAEMPLGNGVEQFIRLKDGKPQVRQKTNQNIIATHTNVAVMMMYTPYGWRGKKGDDQACLEAAVRDQLTAGLWRKVDETLLTSAIEESEEKNSTEPEAKLGGES